MARFGNKKGGLHCFKRKSRKKKSEEFSATYELSMTIKEAVRQKTEPDVFRRAL